MRVRTVGIIEQDPAKGLVKYAKPVGVVAAVTPSTNPAATPVNKSMMALKGRNAVVVAPSPSGYATTLRTVDLMRAELERIGLPANLVQILPQPISKASTQALMEAVGSGPSLLAHKTTSDALTAAVRQLLVWALAMSR